MNNSVGLEILVAKIQAQLAPDAEVIHNAKLPGRWSKADRQIDVLVRQKIGQYEMSIVLDAKDHARPVDVKGVEEFHGLVQDVGAHKGTPVCPKGFTEAAKARAAAFQIDLYSPIDTDPHKWTAKASAPAICDFREAMISFGVSMSAPMPFKIPHGFFSQLAAFDEAGANLGTPFETAIARWNEGRYPTEAREHHRLPIYDAPRVTIDNG